MSDHSIEILIRVSIRFMCVGYDGPQVEPKRMKGFKMSPTTSIITIIHLMELCRQSTWKSSFHSCNASDFYVFARQFTTPNKTWSVLHAVSQLMSLHTASATHTQTNNNKKFLLFCVKSDMNEHFLFFHHFFPFRFVFYSLSLLSSFVEIFRGEN